MSVFFFDYMRPITPKIALSSASYNQLFGKMSEQLANIATGITSLPSEIAKALANHKISPSDAPESPQNSFNPRIKPLPQLNQANFQNVQHWNPSAFLAMRKTAQKDRELEEDEDLSDSSTTPGDSPKTSRSKRDAVLSSYMEDENGTPIPDPERKAARTRARTFWQKLYNQGKAPPKSGKADADIADEYIAFMEDGFPWLRYCSNHWKSMQIWRNHYSGWHNNRKKAAAKAKKAAEAAKAAAEAAKAAAETAEGEDDVIDVDTDINVSQDLPERPAKRLQVEDQTNASKRRRVEENDSAHSNPSRSKSKVCSSICTQLHVF